MVKQTEQQKRITALMKEIRKFGTDWMKGKIKKRQTNFEEKHKHLMPDGDKCFHYHYINRYSPNIFEYKSYPMRINIDTNQNAVVVGSDKSYYINNTISASNRQLSNMIRDKTLPDVGVRGRIIHSSCFALKTITLTLQIHKTPKKCPKGTQKHHCNNSWWYWYLEELTRYEEKGMAFDILMEKTNLCEDVIGLIGEYL